MQKSAYVLFTLAGVALLTSAGGIACPSPRQKRSAPDRRCLRLAHCQRNVWNWPVGIANNIFYVVVFWRARLFADMSLQFVYIALGFLGLYRWLYGGKKHDALRITRINAKTTLYLLIFIAAAVSSLTMYLRRVQDAAPFLDACTAVLSICAQYLLTKKILENVALDCYGYDFRWPVIFTSL